MNDGGRIDSDELKAKGRQDMADHSSSNDPNFCHNEDMANENRLIGFLSILRKKLLRCKTV